MYFGGHSCRLANCTSIVFGKKQIDTKFHKFPKDHTRCAVWIENCKPINLPTIDPDILYRNHRLCSLHFEDEMYSNVEKIRLSNKAIPTIFKNDCIITEEASHHVDVPSEYFDDNTQTESVIIDNPPRCSTPAMSTHSSILFSSCTSLDPISINIQTPVSSTHNSISLDTCSISIQTPNSLTSKTPRKRMLQQRLSNALCSIKELERISNIPQELTV